MEGQAEGEGGPEAGEEAADEDEVRFGHAGGLHGDAADDDAGGMSFTVNQGVQNDEGSHAVTEEKDGLVGGEGGEECLQVSAVISPSGDVTGQAAGAAMTALIPAVDVVTGGGEGCDGVGVAVGVLAHPMDDDDVAVAGWGGSPGLGKEAQLIVAGERVRAGCR